MGGRKGQSNPKKVTNGNRRKSNSNEETKKLNCYYTNEQSYDKCHNSDTPCSNGIRDIVQSIFPEILRREDSSPLSSEELNEELSSIKSLQPSLFALLVRRHFLEKRLGEVSKAAERKKRKNKKKKKSDEPVTSTVLLNSADRHNEYHSSRISNGSCMADEWDWNEEGKDNDDDEDLQLLESELGIANADAIKISTFVSQYMIESTSSTFATESAFSNKEQDKEIISKWNEFLNQLLKKYDSVPSLQDTSSVALPPSRNLTNLLSYIRDRYDKSLDSENIKSSKTVKPSSRYLPSLSTSDISAIIERIQCRTCRNACHNYLECLTSSRTSHLEVDWGGMKANGESSQVDPKMVPKTQIGTFILNENSILVSRRSPVSPTFLNVQKSSEIGDHDVDCAFEYQQLEEGIGGEAIEVSDATCRLDITGCSSTVGGLCLDIVQIGAQGAKYIELDAGMNESVSPFELQNVESFLRDVIIKCGFSDEIEPQISDEIILKVECKANELLAYYKKFIDSEKKSFLAFQSSLEEVTNTMQKNDFNPSVSNLRKCLDTLKMYLDDVLQLVKFVEKSTKCAQVFRHDKKLWVTSFVDDLIQTFESCSRGLIQPSLLRIWNMKQKQSIGSTLPLFNDATQRVLLTQYLEKCSVFMDELHRALYVLSDDRCEGIQENGVATSSFLATMSAYLLVVTAAYSYETYPWEESIDNILKMRNGVVCNTNMRTDVSVLLKDLSDNHVFMCRSIFNEAIPQLDHNIKEKRLDSKSMSIWNANKIMMEECEIMDQNHKDFGFSLESDIAKAENLFDLASILFKQKRYRDEIELLSTQKKGDIKIPPCIYRGIQFGKLLQDRCEGGNGERRVSCIISACLYGWLEKQCIEWHADLTHKELLLDAEEELQQGPDKKLDKKKKRKGSNKKVIIHAESLIENQSVLDSASHDRSNALSIANSQSHLEPSKKIMLEHSDNYIFPSSWSEIEIESNVSHEWTEVRDKKLSLKDRMSSQSKPTVVPVELKSDERNHEKHKKDTSISNTKNEEDRADGVSIIDTHNDDRMEIESFSPYFSNLGVSDRGGVTRAEDFLCSRYFQALKELGVSS